MSPLDHTVLNELREILRDDESALADIIECYLAESLLILASIDSAFEDQDTDSMKIVSNIKSSAHKLKSSSASLAAITLAGICQQIEEKVIQGNLLDTKNLIEQLKQEYALVENALKNLL